MSVISDKLRKEFGEGDAKRDAGLKTPEDIERSDDISYGEHPKWNLLDVYRLKSKKGQKLPVIAIVHGGGWVYGDKEVYQYYGMSLAQRGFAVVNFSYRLAPEYKYPSAIEDICAAFRWIYANAEEYGLDTDNIFAVGDSAGAHLLSMFSCLITNKKFLKEMKKEYPKACFDLPKGMHLNAVALNCGKYDLEKDKDKDEKSVDLIKDFLEHGGTEEEMRLVNGVDHVTGKFPPAFVMTCPGDFLKSQAKYIVNKLNKKEVPFCYRYYGDKKNKLHHVFHCNTRLEEAVKCNDDECGFFKEWIQTS
ncbi:MAG: alpha/beta hydrolase [Lachnospiraceae bacterium]|nr:alpha/beta hydrolase [Lachnospiraceae bacterium]